MRHVTTPKEASRKGRASTSAATKRTPEAPRSSMNRRAAWSMGSVTSVATTLGVKPAKPRAVWPPRGDVEHAVGAARAAPGEQAVEVGAAGMARARDVVLRRSSELRLDVRLVRLGHALAGPGGRSAR